MTDEQNESNEVTETPQEQSSADKFDINSVIQDALKVITDPIGFYRDMPTSGGYVNPMLFVVVLSLATAVVGFLFNLIGLVSYNAAIGGAVTFVMLIFVPIGAIIASFIGGAILFVIWKLMGSERNYETAYRCVAYSFAIGPIVAAISFLPYVANIIKTLWSMFLFYAASIEVHKIKDSTAKIVFGILAVILVLSGIKGERAARNVQNWADEFEARMEKEYKKGSIGNAVKELENVDEMTPEEAGKKFGEFLKGMEEFSKGMEESVKDNDEKESDD